MLGSNWNYPVLLDGSGSWASGGAQLFFSSEVGFGGRAARSETDVPDLWRSRAGTEAFPAGHQQAHGEVLRLQGERLDDKHVSHEMKANMKRLFAVALCLVPSVAMALPLDGNGWTVFTESADTVKVYVSSSTGNDANDGLSESTPKQTLDAGYALLRDGFPDWLLLKKGDTWTNQDFDGWSKGGRSEAERMVLGAYGTGARPLVQPASGSDGWSTQDGPSHLALTGVHFYAYTRDPTNPGYVSSATGGGIQYRDSAGNASANFLIEDVKVEMANTNSVNDRNPAVGLTNLEIRRSVFVDSYSDPGNHSQGIFVYGVSGMRFEENVFDHNGWYGDRDTGGAAGPDGEASKFNHNVYIDNSNPHNTPNGEPTNPADQRGVVIFSGNISSRASSHGLYLRTGGTVTDNLLMKNPLIEVGGGDDPLVHNPDGVDADVFDNVTLHPNDINASLDRGSGLRLATSRNVFVYRNVFAHDESMTPTNTRAVQISSEGPSPAVSLRDNRAWNIAKGAVQGDPLSVSEEEGNIWYDASSAPWTVGGTNQNAEDITYVDPTRTAANYNAHLGGAGTFEAFIAEARLQSKDNWRPEYTAAAANAWIRAGYQEQGAPPPPPPNPTISGNVLTNDTDADGDLLTVSEVNGDPGLVGQQLVMSLGTLVINADGSWTYELTSPRQASDIVETCQYRCTDGIVDSNETTLSVTVQGDGPNNATPVANPDAGEL